MSRVHILSSDVISKIAAGEVIERPASVIKELVENSLDAGSNLIELHLKDAGKSLIHLKDSGYGIDHDDLETVFERHSTSKIKTADDLFDIHSLGFRGEALYSIAAVSDITLRSKTKKQDSGWEIHMRGGKKVNLKPAATHNGTEIEIKELFFNTPARRKFLKSNTTELNQILSTLIPYCLFYPQCRFLVTHEKRTLLDLAPTENHIQRVAETLNLENTHLLELSENFSEQRFSARMIIGDINISRSRRDMQFIFINGRPVQSKAISFHLNDIYRLILPPNSYPFFTLFLTIPAGHVDVNIHPTKREVKIHDEHNLMPLLRHMVEQTLMTKGKPKEIKEKVSLDEKAIALRRALEKSTPHDSTFPQSSEREVPITGISENTSVTEQYTFPKQDNFIPDGSSSIQNAGQNLINKFSRSRYLGAFINKFLLFEADRSLLIVDQHAAQERIVFEALIRQMERGKVEVQNLLTPDLLKVSMTEMLAWEESKETLEKLGLTSTQFDKDTIAIHSCPALLSDPMRAVRELLTGGNISRADHATLARRACRASIRAGDPLKASQAEFQKDQLLKCRDPFTCPHGRPTVIEIKENFLDRQFFRT
ncbi:MAG: DNA mismatch repair endonuclease MutL [Candidatus Omnitrophica bacterium]|nr:DNA mismatch repair endonuclease MutL [Candidatus Omnitrophota bacterium]